jgi:iron complex outermembrane receptor protein
MSIEQLMDIEVTTVSRQESTVGQSPAAIHVITQEDIRRSGATTIPELFRRVPGINVARIDGNKWAVSARGFNNRFADKLLVQMDGRTVYNPLFSGVFWDAVDYPLEDIERIEVICGLGASVWGANAVNGIINIITKPATETQGGLVSGGRGTEEQGFGTFRYGGKLGNDLHYRVYGKGFTRDEQFSQEGDPHEGAFGVTRISIPKSCWRMRSVIGRKEGLAAERARAAAGKISRKKTKGKRK